MASTVGETGRPTQHRILKQLTLAVAGMVERGVEASTGRRVPVKFEYVEPGKKVEEHFTLLHYWMERASDRMPDRVLEKTRDGEIFRNPPLLMLARYTLTAWASPPDDQELLCAALRSIYDDPEIKPQGGKAEEDAIHFEDKPSVEMTTRYSFDEQRLVAEAFGMPLRPSLRIDVHFPIHSEQKTTVKRVKERVVEYKKIE